MTSGVNPTSIPCNVPSDGSNWPNSNVCDQSPVVAPIERICSGVWIDELID